LRALVVDDEAPARRRLARMLESLTDVRVVAQLEDTRALLDALQTLSADVLFLDVRMPGVDGMSLAQSRAGLPPIVFVTAYDQYAIGAFGVDAVDYLLKPVRPERLIAAVARVQRRVSGAGTANEPAATPTLATVPAPATALAPPGPPRIISGTRNMIQLFDARSITRFWSSDKYTQFRAEGEEHLTEEPLAALAERLSPYGFLRVHRAELVRSDAVRALRSTGGHYELCLADGQCARVSRRAVQAIKTALGLG
jgi:DNA-binding LytR/AlgR family response regulator